MTAEELAFLNEREEDNAKIEAAMPQYEDTNYDY